MTQWRDETDKGERDREITRWDEETGVIMDLKKRQIRSPLSARTFTALEMERGRSCTDFICPKKGNNGRSGRMQWVAQVASLQLNM